MFVKKGKNFLISSLKVSQKLCIKNDGKKEKKILISSTKMMDRKEKLRYFLKKHDEYPRTSLPCTYVIFSVTKYLKK